MKEHRDFFNYWGNSWLLPLYFKGNNLSPKNEFDRQTIKEFTVRLAIQFEHEEEQEYNSPVCYAKSLDLRDDFLVTSDNNSFSSGNLQNYLRAILHATIFSSEQKSFLKLKKVAVPYPTSRKTFWQLEELGCQIYEIHRLSFTIHTGAEAFFTSGNNLVSRDVKNSWDLTDPQTGNGRVWINDKQYFDSVPLKAWSFKFGGFQPAYEWLKNSRDSVLSKDNVLQFQKIINALLKIDQLINQINKKVEDAS